MKFVIASSLIAAASARNLQDLANIAGFTPLTDVRDQVSDFLFVGGVLLTLHPMDLWIT